MNNLLLFLALFGMLFSCNEPKARKPVQQKSGSFIEASVERNIKLLETETALIEDYMENNPQHQYHVSNSGFWYYYKVKDSTKTTYPSFGDRLVFTYSIEDFKDNILVTEQENGIQDYRVDQTNQDLISGIRDGIKLMREGERVTFLLPSYKAFGYYGYEDKIGANVSLQTTVTLRKIEKNE